MIWFDFDNSPHVLIFKNILKELDKLGERYFVTSREFAQTLDLLKLYNIQNNLIGHHGGKSKVKKVFNLIERIYQLNVFLSRNRLKPSLSISHGSRAQTICSYLNRIQSIVMMDYEKTESKIFNLFAGYILFPNFIPDQKLKESGINLKRVIKYNAFKEELYLNEFKPDLNFRKELGVEFDSILVVIRPPSFTSNYHDDKSKIILLNLLKKLLEIDNTEILYLSRTEVEKEFILKTFRETKIRIPNKVYDGLQLIYAADIVFSGGGTMNRESALIGTETYSFFTGAKPYLDEYLENIGRLSFINSVEDLNKIIITKKDKKDILIHNKNITKELIELFLEIKNKTKKEYFYASTISRS